jgi:hypothetical protein
MKRFTNFIVALLVFNQTIHEPLSELFRGVFEINLLDGILEGSVDRVLRIID